MDIRKFFVNLKRKKNNSSDEEENEEIEKQPSVSADTPVAGPSEQSDMEIVPPDCGDEENKDEGDSYHEHDIGKFVGLASTIPVAKKKHLLENGWVPPKNYNFAADAQHLKRKFNHQWLDTYSPWLSYSKRLKGAFCKYCVLFPPSTSMMRGGWGSFIIRPFTKYKDVHEHCKAHVLTQAHQAAVQSAKSLLNATPVDIKLHKSSQKLIEENKKILSSIVSCIIFSGTHDLPLRGKNLDEGVFIDLCRLRIDAGDSELQHHFDHGPKNAAYRSPGIQNEIIDICGAIIKDRFARRIQEACAYSILADETADISGKEQLSVGLRFFDDTASDSEIKEEFLGFVELEGLNATSVAKAIDDFVTSLNLDLDKCVGLGFDGCSTMSGKENGVQAILREKYQKAMYFHCSSHKLNLVVNDLNALPEIRNCVGTIKEVITFFRESVLRRRLIANIPKLCETRWSEKYKSIRIFKDHFVNIVEALETLAEEGNAATRKNAYQMHAAACKSSFIVSVALIAKYSAILEPVANILQSKALDIVKGEQHIQSILGLLRDHREAAEKVTADVLKEAGDIAKCLNVDLTITRIAGRQKHRSNPPAENPSEFWRRSLIIPYLDSIISSLETRFSADKSPAFALTHFHPSNMKDVSFEEWSEMIASCATFYNLKGIDGEKELWFKMWSKEPKTTDLSIVDVLKKTGNFFPSIRKALVILFSLPCTTSTVERSFSSLRRIKTWLRSTIGPNRLNGLAMLSIHRQWVFANEKEFIQDVVRKFAANPRKLLFLN